MDCAAHIECRKTRYLQQLGIDALPGKGCIGVQGQWQHMLALIHRSARASLCNRGYDRKMRRMWRDPDIDFACGRFGHAVPAKVIGRIRGSAQIR